MKYEIDIIYKIKIILKLFFTIFLTPLLEPFPLEVVFAWKEVVFPTVEQEEDEEEEEKEVVFPGMFPLRGLEIVFEFIMSGEYSYNNNILPIIFFVLTIMFFK